MLRVDKKQKFQTLVDNIDRCELCERMQGRCKVLSEKNGALDAEVLFVGEAPGRLGADRTQIPFHGDQTGRNFERLMGIAGLTRNEVFITNAVLCNPRDARGNNATPVMAELRNCSLYLSLLLDIVKPNLIVSLGRQALSALNTIEPHTLELRRDIGKPTSWSHFTVLPLYHPGPRAASHRPFPQQAMDFTLVSEILGRPYKHGQLPLLNHFEPSLLQRVLYRIIQQLGSVSKFKLAKLLYLLDWQEVKDNGDVLTGSYYIAQANGPLATTLSQALGEMEGYEVTLQFQGNTPTYRVGRSPRQNLVLPSNVAEKVDDVVQQNHSLTDARIKVRTYLTKPMKDIIRRQQRGERVLNHPVFEGWIQPKDKP